MPEQSNNPLYLVGAYLGLLAGLILYLKGWHPFWWLPPLLGINLNSLLILDVLGGGLAGYVIHILFRIFEWEDGNKGMKIKK